MSFDEGSALIYFITIYRVTVQPWNVLDRTNHMAAAECEPYTLDISCSTHWIYCKRLRAEIVTTDHSNESHTKFRFATFKVTLEVPISFTPKLWGFRRNFFFSKVTTRSIRMSPHRAPRPESKIQPERRECREENLILYFNTLY